MTKGRDRLGQPLPKRSRTLTGTGREYFQIRGPNFLRHPKVV
jgi:hypothetical protein